MSEAVGLDALSLDWVLIASACVFCIGLLGILIRKNLLVMLMSVELMLNAVNLAFVAYGRHHQDLGGQMSVFFIITVAAAESAVGLGLLIAMFRTLKSVATTELELMKE